MIYVVYEEKKIIEKENLLNMIEQSYSLIDMSKKYHICRRTIRKLIKEYQIDLLNFKSKDDKYKYIINTKLNKLTILDIKYNSYNDKCFLCLCECGKNTLIPVHRIINKEAISCGCWIARKRHPSESSALAIYTSTYSDGDISFNDFLKLSKNNCYYCNAEPFTKFNKFKIGTANEYSLEHGNYIYNGLDRLDSNLAHYKNNIVTCCKYCNYAKNNLSLNEFVSHIKLLNSFRIKQYNGDYSNIIFPKLLYLYSDFIKPKNYTNGETPGVIETGTIFGKLTVIHFVDRDRVACLCKCNKIVITHRHRLRYGTAKSCGSPSCRSKYDIRVRVAKDILSSSYSDGNLQLSEFYELSQMNCYYCGSSPRNKQYARKDKEKLFPFVFNGLDRVNPICKHDLNNVIPCCIICNKMKNDMSLYAFNDWLNRINNNLLLKL